MTNSQFLEDDIYITGIAGAYPNSRSIYELQENLFNKVDLVSDDERRWKHMENDIPQRTGKLYDIDRFDASFFDISYKRGHFLDPAARILHEKVFESIIDAGFNPCELRGKKVGVFIGSSFQESGFSSCYSFGGLHDHGSVSSSLCILSNYISEWLGVIGPSVTVETACSSSSYAIELAVKALQEGRCDAAIAGGTNLCLLKEVSQKFYTLGVLSEDGKCKCFDEKANGYCRSETVATVFLQKAKDSRRVYAKIVHAKTNCDGFKEQGITFPAGQIQKKLLESFYKECRIAPSAVEYLEAHGTGTRVGDPEELKAIDDVFCPGRPGPLIIGSVKSNLGHSEPAAGICALSKLVIAYHTGYIPPNINFSKPREGVAALEEGRLKVVTEKRPWSRGLAAFSSFGFGGANAHILLDNVSRAKVNKGLPLDDLPRLVCVSGRTKSAVTKILDHLESKTVDVDEVRLWHAIHEHDISKHPYRGFIILTSGLNKSMQLERNVKHYTSERMPVYFVYSGSCELWPSMSRNLMKLPVFANIIQKCHEILKNNRIDLMKMLTDLNPGDFSNVKNCVICTIAIQLGFTEVLKEVAIKPDRVFGSGIGELSAAYADKTLTLEQVVLAAYHVAEALNEEGLSCSTVTQLLKSLKAISLSYKFDNLVNNLQNPVELLKKLENCEENALVIEVTPCGMQEFGKFTKVSLANKDEDGLRVLLFALGKLFQEGLNPHLANIYPPVKFPVAQGTSMFSHLIEWNHNESWFAQKLDNLLSYDALETIVHVTLEHDNKKYLSGHVIDGRNLYPATGYLEIVWNAFAKLINVMNTEISVIFENVNLYRATTIPKTGSLEFKVSIQKETGNFEVVESNTVVVTGRIFEKKNVAAEYRVIPEEATNSIDDKGPSVNLTAKDFYKELNLRGYQYKGAFRGVLGCNIKGTRGRIVWKQNWVTFLDTMLQPMIVAQDTRSLYVPTRIEKLSIDVDVHNEMLKKLMGDLKVFTFQTYPHLEITRIGGVELRGLHVTAISKKPPLGIPVYEKYQFVPFYGTKRMPFDDILRFNLQLVHENIHTYKFKCLELVNEEYEKNKLEPAITVVDEILADLPLVQADLQVITKDSLELPSNIIVSNKFSNESNIIVFIGANLLERDDILKEAAKILKGDGYIISRENLFSDPKQYSNKIFEIVTIHKTESECVILLRRKTAVRSYKFVRILTADDTFSWIDDVKKEMSDSQKLVLYSQNESNNGLLGLVSCLRREPGGENVHGLLIDDPQAPAFEPKLELYREQLMRNLPMNIYKEGKWGTYCHLLLKNQKTVSSPHAYLNTTVTGDLSSLRWIQGPLKVDQTFKSPNTKLVHVYCSGMNFRDVMTATGRVTKDSVARGRIAQECVQGLEISGRMPNGTRVMALSNKGTANLASVETALTWPIPDEWTLREAATVPVAYATVYASLLLIGKMRRGESILIHAGSGAVGQAAINVALHYGLEVFTTVGTPAKKEIIKKLFPLIKDSHIGNSRDTTFEEMIQRETKGKGVHLVLNSLADEKLQASVRCLARRGRFLEIGKYDITINTLIEMYIFKKEISFHSVMLDYLYEDASPKMQQNLKKLILAGIESGAVRPVTNCSFEKHEVTSAFRYMAAGKHIGKIVINIREEELNGEIPVKPVCAPIDAVPRYLCDENEVYVLVGGLGGFGLELADWLVLRGARKLLLCSRRGVSNGYQAMRIGIWTSYGADVQISTTDVTTEAGTEEMLRQANSMGPVRAVFNLAVILKDALFENQTQETFRQSFGPKALATIHLDKLTRKLCSKLKDFVIFSSVVCGRGNAGQTNYGFSNSVMERICETRKKDGLPALAIQWGAVGDVGLVADMQEENIQLEIGGTLQQRIVSCLEAVDVLLTQETSAIVSSIVVAEKKRSGSHIGTAVDAVANIMGIKDLKMVSHQAPLADLGMDSIMAVEIKQTLERDFEIFLSAPEIRNLTFAKLAETNAEETEKSTLIPTLAEEKPDKMDFLHLVLQNLGDEKLASQSLVWLPSLKTITETTKEKSVFMMSGIESSANTLRPLCSKLKCKAGVLQLGTDHLQENLNQMADRLYPVLKLQISPGSPFVLLGYSFGTLVQLKLAAKLESDGYRGIIICVDGGPEFSNILAKSVIITDGDFSNVERVQKSVLEKIIDIFIPKDMRSIVKKEVFQYDSFDEKIRHLVNVTPDSLQYSKKYLTDMIYAVYHRMSLIINSDSEEKYNKIKSHIVLIRSELLPSLVECSESYGLDKLSEGDVTIHRLNENHHGIIECEEIANIINEIVKKVEV